MSTLPWVKLCKEDEWRHYGKQYWSSFRNLQHCYGKYFLRPFNNLKKYTGTVTNLICYTFIECFMLLQPNCIDHTCVGKFLVLQIINVSLTDLNYFILPLTAMQLIPNARDDESLSSFLTSATRTYLASSVSLALFLWTCLFTWYIIIYLLRDAANKRCSKQNPYTKPLVSCPVKWVECL